MLDKKTDAVLRLLTDNVGDGYKVLNKSQLMSQLPPRLHIDEQTFQGILSFLKDNDYLDVKYQDKEEICLAATVKAASYKENEQNVVQRANIPSWQVALLIAGVFFAAFAGALVAALLGKLM